MNQYRVLYQWMGRHYETVMQQHSAVKAIQAAQVAIMSGAKIYGVEPARE